MLLAGALWWLYFDSAAEINLRVLQLSGGSPTMARAIFAVGHMVPAFALLIIAAGVGLLLEEEPPAGRLLAGLRRARDLRHQHAGVVGRAAPARRRRAGPRPRRDVRARAARPRAAPLPLGAGGRDDRVGAW